jgi:sulfoxide reductase heme-binding subunit YedZ
MVTATVTNPLWFVTRATGVTALILLTVTVVLGVAGVRRLRTRRIPRFVVDAVHRNAALLAVCFLVAHIGTAVLDGFVPIAPLDAVLPFGASYRPFWLGLGAVSVDLLIAVVLTSLLRRRIGYRVWRATHWLAYGSWPVALVHSLGTGSDAGTSWMLAISAICTAAVLAAVLTRWAPSMRGRPRPPHSTPPRPVPRRPGPRHPGAVPRLGAGR